MYCVVVDQCPKIASAAHRSQSIRLVSSGIVMEVKCGTGYSFRDGTRSVTVECLANRQWSAKVKNCEGTHTLVYIYSTWSVARERIFNRVVKTNLFQLGAQ